MYECSVSNGEPSARFTICSCDEIEWPDDLTSSRGDSGLRLRKASVAVFSPPNATSKSMVHSAFLPAQDGQNQSRWIDGASQAPSTAFLVTERTGDLDSDAKAL